MPGSRGLCCQRAPASQTTSAMFEKLRVAGGSGGSGDRGQTLQLIGLLAVHTVYVGPVWLISP
jgi:hypothetical protein